MKNQIDPINLHHSFTQIIASFIDLFFLPNSVGKFQELVLELVGLMQKAYFFNLLQLRVLTSLGSYFKDTITFRVLFKIRILGLFSEVWFASVLPIVLSEY